MRIKLDVEIPDKIVKESLRQLKLRTYLGGLSYTEILLEKLLTEAGLIEKVEDYKVKY